MEMCGKLTLDLGTQKSNLKQREIITNMSFGNLELEVSALDVETGKKVKTFVDFYSEKNQQYNTKF